MHQLLQFLCPRKEEKNVQMNAKNKSDEEMVSWLSLNIVKKTKQKTLFILLTNGFRFKQSPKYKQNKCSFSTWMNTDLYVCMCNIHTPVDLKGPEPRVFRELTCQSPGAVLTLWQTCGNLSAAFWLLWQRPRCFLLAGLSASSPTTHRMSVNNKHPKVSV